jgi:hypothetical protein
MCSGPSGGNNDRDAAANQFGRKFRQPIRLIVSPPVDDRNILALNIANLS